MIPQLSEGTSVRKPSQQLCKELQEEDARDLRLRRAMIRVSLVGMAGMAIVSLFQTGVIKHLPDPPLKSFDSEKVNSSDTAYGYGIPDGPMTLAAHGINVALAAAGGKDRAREQPWIPLMASALAGAQALVASTSSMRCFSSTMRGAATALLTRKALAAVTPFAIP